MSKKTTFALTLFAMFWFVVGGLAAFSWRRVSTSPLIESVTSDTTTTIDTISDIAPAPKDSTPVKTVVRWLPMANPKASGSAHEESVDHLYSVSEDTVTQWQLFGNSEHPQDSALVEIPITSKHYSSDEYDAWVSGFEPSLDSIKVYNETQLITETITRFEPPNKWGLDIVGGVDYGITSKKLLPYAGGELTLNKHNRLQVGVEVGIKKNEVTKDFEPYAGAKLRVKIH